MVDEWLHGVDWNYFWYPLINLACIGVLLLNAAEHARERNYWRKKAERLEAEAAREAREGE